MRLFAVVASLLLVTAAAEAKPVKRANRHTAVKTKAPAKRSAHAGKPLPRIRAAYVVRGPVEGQSLGAPWQGKLRQPTELPAGDGYVIRRPWRAFGTATTVDIIHDALTDIRVQFPEAHAIAVGDISQESGGQITQHRSHQSGRDVDIGLIYKTQPANYPDDFVSASADNLDCEATYALLNEFAETATKDGGVQMIFLDYKVQGLLYDWAKANGEDVSILDKLFQYPNRGAQTLVRHIANHDNHMHVRFKCPESDTSCRN